MEYRNTEEYIKENTKRDQEQYLNDIATEAKNAAYRNDIRGVYAAITKLTSSKPKNGSVLATGRMEKYLESRKKV